MFGTLTRCKMLGHTVFHKRTSWSLLKAHAKLLGLRRANMGTDALAQRGHRPGAWNAGRAPVAVSLATGPRALRCLCSMSTTPSLAVFKQARAQLCFSLTAAQGFTTLAAA